MRFTKNKEEYAAYYKSLTPKSPLLRDLTGAFLIGGTICLLGQLFTEGYTALGADKELAATLTSVTLVALGILLSALGLYARLAKFAGAGTLVPITGFANSMASAAIEFKSEGYIRCGRKNVHHCGAGDRVRGKRQRGVWGNILDYNAVLM